MTNLRYFSEEISALVLDPINERSTRVSYYFSYPPSLPEISLFMWYLYGLTILAGLANAIQPGQNATLAKSLGLPVTAGLIIIIVSMVTLLGGGLAMGKLGWPSLHQLAEVPWWAWPGGMLSVLLILAQLYAAASIGAASFLGIIVTVGVLGSIVLDHFGWVGYPVHPFSVWRGIGAGLMVAGVALVALF